MKKINIQCYDNGRASLKTKDVHIESENIASIIEVDFSQVEYKNYQKGLDIESGSYLLRYFLGNDEIVFKELTYENTLPGELVITPFVFDETTDRKVRYLTDYSVIIHKRRSVASQDAPDNVDLILEEISRFFEETTGKLVVDMVFNKDTKLLSLILENGDEISTIIDVADYGPDLELKLDKDFSALPAQTNPLLTDVLVINRGTTVQKVTLGNLLSQVDNEIFIIVATLPATGVANKIYLVPSSEPETQNTYDEFIWVNNAWENLGTIALDLSNYYNKTEIDTMIGDIESVLDTILEIVGGGGEVVENYVRFVSEEERTITPKYTNSGVTLQYSVDSGATWTTIASGSATTSATEHWFRGEATGTKALFTGAYSSNQWLFSGSSDLEVYGNLNFLLCDTLGDEVAPTSLGDNGYSNMFRNCTSLTTAPKLPATTLANDCYSNMFNGCTSLTTAPKLPATTLANDCYSNMFNGCTSLTTAPELPATTMVEFCYYQMFQGCTSLTTAPKLPATTLKNYCYGFMFNGCTSLTTAPKLPATNLAKYCYESMFNGCTSFKVSATQTGSYTYAWRIPTTGTGNTSSYWNIYMLDGTGGTFTSNPTINTTYWVENEPV